MPDQDADEKLRREFNNWVLTGRADGMEKHHLSIAEQTIRRMDLRPGERVLDLGCGTGWAGRLIARLVSEGPVGFGQVIGLDISDEMIARAREDSKEFENLLFVWGSAEKIPWEENYFDKVLSIEAFYYYPDQERVISELFRVMAPKARLYILINLYKENPYSLYWVDKLGVPVQMRSENEYAEMLKRHTFEEIEIQHIPDESPTPEEYRGSWFSNAEEVREYKRIGALLLTARKPDFLTPRRGIETYY
jgi:ubiquinone/menaquinone biosynthesis C-methylase UbiE